MGDRLVRKGLALGIIVLFIGVTVSSNFNINIIEPVKAEDLSIKLDRFENSIVGMEISKAQVKPIVKQVKKFFNAPLAVTVIPGYHPTVASDTFGNIVLAFEYDTEYDTSVGFISSLDGGNTWSDQYVFLPDSAELPDIDSCGDGRFLGSMVPYDYYSTLYMIMITDPGSIPDGIEFLYLDFGPDITNFGSVAVAGYTDEEYPWMFGSYAIVCDKVGPISYIGVPIYFYGAFYNEEYQIFQVDFYPTITGCKVAANDIDLVTLYAYGVWNIYNSETGEMDIMVISWDFGTWEQNGEYTIHPQRGSYLIKKAGNDDYIDVSAHNDNVIIVSERDSDVVAYYSTNGMTIHYESTITTDAWNPRIVHNGNNIATCTFIKDNSVYYSRTHDGGATWSSPKRIDEPENNNVPEEYKAADVCGFGAAWMNSGDGFIYFADIGLPPNSPYIDGPDHGRPGVEYTYCINLSDPDNDSLFVLWDWGDGTSTDWLGPYGSGEEVCASHTWNKKGIFIISVTVKDKYGATVTAYKEVTMPRNKGINTPFIQFLQNLLENHSNMFLIMQKIIQRLKLQ